MALLLVNGLFTQNRKCLKRLLEPKWSQICTTAFHMFIWTLNQSTFSNPFFSLSTDHLLASCVNSSPHKTTPVHWSSSNLTQPDDLKLIGLLLFQGLGQRLTLPLTRLRHFLCIIVRPSLPSLSRIRPCLFILGAFPVVRLDVILDTPAHELLRLRAGQARIRDAGVVFKPVDQVVDVVVADPWVVAQRELP